MTRLQNWGENMYLSRIKLDPANRNTLRALSEPKLFHGALENIFPGPRTRKLWRIDSLNGDLYILLLSETVPDFSGFCSQFCRTAEDVQSKPYDGLLSRIENGSKWRFRLTANPVKSLRVENDRGKIHAHITAAYQKEWLLAKSEKCGFHLSEDFFDVTQSRWYQFYKKDQNRVSLLAVTYEGVLEVTDEVVFRKAICEGIGRGKAYGMGLLTVMHI